MNTLKAALLGAVTLGAVNTAHAADMAESYAPTVNAQNFDWTGFYVGLVGGYGMGEAYNAAGVIGIAPNLFNAVSGLIGGVTVGANLQIDQFVLGVEGDIQFSGMTQTLPAGGGFTFTSTLDYYSTVRGRVGYAFDQVLPYLTGGLALGQGTLSSNSPLVGSSTQTHVGYTIGAGVEVAATENITFKGEYLYTDLGTQTYALPGPTTAGLRFHTIRAGVNFLF